MVTKILKKAFIIFLVIVIGALIVRMFISSDKTTFDDFAVSEDSLAAYAESGALTVKTLAQKDKFSGAGYFAAYSLFYVEETGEIQVTVRYNVSAVDYTGVESEEDFEFVLLKKENAQDLSVSTDGEKKEHDLFTWYDGDYYYPESVEEKSKYGLYRFEKLTFKGVKLDEGGIDASEIAVVMIPTSLTLPSPADDAVTRMHVYESIFDSQTVHFANQPLDAYRLSKKLVAALEEK